MLRHIKNRVPASRLELLRQVPVFAQRSDDELAEIDSLVDRVSVHAGTVLMVEGRPGREAFIVLSGEAEVRVAGHFVHTAGAGEVLGEMSLLDLQPRSATVIASSQMDLLVVNPRNFGSLVRNPRTAQWIARTLAQRLRDTRGSASPHNGDAQHTSRGPAAGGRSLTNDAVRAVVAPDNEQNAVSGRPRPPQNAV